MSMLIGHVHHLYTTEHAMENIAYHRFPLISVTLLSLVEIHQVNTRLYISSFPILLLLSFLIFIGLQKLSLFICPVKTLKCQGIKYQIFT